VNIQSGAHAETSKRADKKAVGHKQGANCTEET